MKADAKEIICTDSKNEESFENEIKFYKENKDNNGIPKLYVSDTTKSVVPYYYEIIDPTIPALFLP